MTGQDLEEEPLFRVMFPSPYHHFLSYLFGTQIVILIVSIFSGYTTVIWQQQIAPHRWTASLAPLEMRMLRTGLT